MRFKTSRAKLLPAVATINGIVERRQTLPILGNFLLSVHAAGITLTATDLEMEITTTLEVETEGQGDITLPAKKFLDICRALPDTAEIEVKLEEEKILIKSLRSRFSLGTLPARDYPSIQAMTEDVNFEIAQQELKHLFAVTSFSMAAQDVRYYLNGLLMEIGTERLKVIATDGHRLAIAERNSACLPEARNVLLPRKAVLELGKLLSNSDAMTNVQVNSGYAKFFLGTSVFTTKLIDGKFPDYERVIPKNLDKTAVIHKETMRQALSRASILSSDKYKGIRLTFEEQVLHLQSHNPEQDEAEEEIEIEYQGESVTIGFNVSYLMEILGAIDADTVVMEMTNNDSSALLKAADDTRALYVIMPMRL